MDDHSLTKAQQSLLDIPLDAQVFLEGPAGTGKTTVGVARLMEMLEMGVRGDEILLMVPQRTLATPYYQALHRPEVPAGGVVSVLTLGGLARRMVDLFWPVVVEDAGFAHPEEPPTFLTLETAQYYMAYLVRPLLEGGMFDSVTIDHNRLYSQLLDDLNKAAVVGFPYSEIGERLEAAWIGDKGQTHVYQDVQKSIDHFRDFCLKHNLLDFSLQVEVFRDHLLKMAGPHAYLKGICRHLLVDNLEEDTPVTHDLLAEWLPELDSALLIFDQGAGYRRFLGADPQGGYALKGLCNHHLSFDASLVMSPDIAGLGERLASALDPQKTIQEEPVWAVEGRKEPGAPMGALHVSVHNYYPQMLDWVAGEIEKLVHGNEIPPGEIVVLSPFLSDSLRFSLASRLKARQIPVRSHRPSRALRDEPAARTLLTLSALAHPEWGIKPEGPDIVSALVGAIQGLDLVRAQLLVQIVYRLVDGAPRLSSFEDIQPAAQERITYRFGANYERLRNWLAAYQQAPADFDHFFSRLFGEVLSQPGFGFNESYDSGEVCANLIESVRKFRWVAGDVLEEAGVSLGLEYLKMVGDGVIASQYLRSWGAGEENAVLLAPAYTFLMNNRPVDVQFWLDAGSRGWSERLYQPLTHPYVLSRHWPMGRSWGESDEVQAGMEALYRLGLGLLRRCRHGVYLGLSDLGERGYEQRGPLLRAFQRLVREVQRDV